MKNINKEKGKLVEIILKMKNSIEPSELKEVNRLYDRYVSVKRADIIRLQSYRSFLRGYLKAKYDHGRED